MSIESGIFIDRLQARVCSSLYLSPKVYIVIHGKSYLLFYELVKDIVLYLCDGNKLNILLHGCSWLVLQFDVFD